jgi:hypothetical protein
MYIGIVTDKKPVVLTYAHCVLAESTSSMCLPPLKQFASRWYSDAVLDSTLHLVPVSQPLPSSVYFVISHEFTVIPGFDHFHVSIFRQPVWITEIRRGQAHTVMIHNHYHHMSIGIPNRHQICTRISQCLFCQLAPKCPDLSPYRYPTHILSHNLCHNLINVFV